MRHYILWFCGIILGGICIPIAFSSLIALGGKSVLIHIVSFLICIGIAITWFNSSIACFAVSGRSLMILLSIAFKLWTSPDLRSRLLNPIHGEDLSKVCVDTMIAGGNEETVGGANIFTQNELAELALNAWEKPVKISHLSDWTRRFSSKAVAQV